jgi:fermentation-respiration switch protein FrsA (DUF1100 family)
MPIRGLLELNKIADMLHQKLPDITCPVTIVHGSNDPVVDPESAKIIHDRIGSLDKQLRIVESERHSILHEDIDNTQAIVIARLSEFEILPPSQLAKPLIFLAHVKANFSRLTKQLMSDSKSVEPTNS